MVLMTRTAPFDTSMLIDTAIAALSHIVVTTCRTMCVCIDDDVDVTTIASIERIGAVLYDATNDDNVPIAIDTIIHMMTNARPNAIDDNVRKSVLNIERAALQLLNDLRPD